MTDLLHCANRTGRQAAFHIHLKSNVMAESPAEKLVVKCACSARFRVPATAAGKRIKCPKCAEPVRVSAGPVDAKSPDSSRDPSGQGRTTATSSASIGKAMPRKAARPITNEAIAAPATGDLLEMLAGDEATAVTTDPGMKQTCPNCASPMASEAVICVGCGYDRRTGKTRKMASGVDSEPAAKVSALDVVKAIPIATGGAKIMFGLLGSSIGAGLGAGLWFGILVSANREMSLIAWIVGVLAGIGMYAGYRDKTAFAGMIAGAVAFAGIFGAKVAFAAHLFGSVVFSDFGLLAKAIGESMFNPWDAICSLIAIATAYGIASGMTYNDD